MKAMKIKKHTSIKIQKPEGHIPKAPTLDDLLYVDGQHQVIEADNDAVINDLPQPTTSTILPVETEIQHNKGIDLENINFYQKKLYPLLASSIEFINKAELLDEQQLLEYYRNQQLELIDNFIDVFIQQELEPRNNLYELLLAYKDISEHIESNDELKAKKQREMHQINNEVWEVTEQTIEKMGKCGCDRKAKGYGTYKIAQLKRERMILLKDCIEMLNQSEFDVGFCYCIRGSALALQIQWIIMELCEKFFMENQIQLNSLPILLSKNINISKTRQAIRGALSDLFYFLRLPMLTMRFQQSLINWTTELGAILLKACVPDDLFFLLSHILRTPSPFNKWATTLVQTFVTAPMLELQKSIDVFVTMLSMLMQPPKYREHFLHTLNKFYEGENTWNVISEDGDLDYADLGAIFEQDLIDLLAQFPIRTLFTITFRHFTLIHNGNRLQILYSLVSFVSILIKIFDKGLQTYEKMKNFCKRIADNISKIVYYFCSYWCLVRAELAKYERQLLQNEVNRIILHAVYYIISKNSAGIRQFLINFPYDAITENCRLRCQILLRTTPNEKIPNVQMLYDIPDNELIDKVKKNNLFVNQLESINRKTDELTYTISALASVVSYSEHDLQYFVTEIIDICFLNEVLRDDFYKVGSICMATMIEHNPFLLGPVLHYIDRHVDHLDDYAVNILNNVPLHMCKLSVEDIADRLSKWLIQRSINHPASIIARHVISAMNWSIQDNGETWLPLEVHDICAETIVKAHLSKCKQQNSLISKPLSKISRLTTKCSDIEQIFDRFCWDVLLKLKIREKLDTPLPPNDLTAFFLFLVQKGLSCQIEFMNTGIRYFQELVNSSCYGAAVVLLTRIVRIFSDGLNLLTEDTTFCDCLERLLHADESTSYAGYALQFIFGFDKFPGPVLTMISASLTYQITVDDANFYERRKQSARTWLKLLTCPKFNYKWNEDKTILYLIGSIVKCAILYDYERLFELGTIIQNLYKIQYDQWKGSLRSPLTWFTSYVCPPLLAYNLFHVSPWATYLLLIVEQQTFPEFYTHLHNVIGKRPDRKFDEIIKKACARSNIYLTVERLVYYRWLQFCCTDNVFFNDDFTLHPIFILALQQLAIVMFSRQHYEGRLFCPGWNYFYCKQSETLFNKLRNKVFPKAEITNDSKNDSVNFEENYSFNLQQTSTAPIKTHLLMNAIRQWLVNECCYRTEQELNYKNLPMNYLLEMIIAGDKHIWAEFVDMNRIRTELHHNAKLYSQYCHLNGDFMVNSQRSSSSPSCNHQHFLRHTNLTQFFSTFELDLNANPYTTVAKIRERITEIEGRPFPQVPIHQNLPIPDRSFFLNSDVGADSVAILRFGTYLDELNKAAKQFIDTKEFVEKSDTIYLELFQQLYKEIQINITITLQCENNNMLQINKCPKPSVVELMINPFEYQQEIAAKMNKNRQEREVQLGKLLSQADNFAITCAQLEQICTYMQEQANYHSFQLNPYLVTEKLQSFICDYSDFHNKTNNNSDLLNIGMNLYHQLHSSIQGFQLLFPAGMESYSVCLKKLGKAFVFNNPTEQLNLMRVILGGNPLNYLLVEHFTPHCVQPPELLAQLYSELSASVRQSTTSEAALLLLRRLDIKHAGRQLPTNQFHALMPIIFENLASVTGNNKNENTTITTLRELCLEHFMHAMFHHFPHNFLNGLRLALSDCDRQCIPNVFFDELAKRLCIDMLIAEDSFNESDHIQNISFEFDHSTEKETKSGNFKIGQEKALECVHLVSQQLITSRKELNSRLFTVWSPYLEQVCKLVDFFLRIYVKYIFRPDATAATMEKELNSAFNRSLECWAPLLEPIPISHLHPWTQNDIALAQKVFDRLLRHLLWLPYNLYLPPGSECPESLFWQYFVTRLVSTKLKNASIGHNNGTKHIYNVYENKLTALKWNRFCPTLLDLGVIDELLSNSDLQLTPIIADIIVRLPWPNLVQKYTESYQPLEAICAFHSLSLSIFAKCIYRRENYTNSRNSMARQLKWLYDNCQWALTKVDSVEQTGAFLANNLPDSEEWLNGRSEASSYALDDAQQCFQSIWRQVCHFSTIPVNLHLQIPIADLDIPRKRAIYVRTQLRILFRPVSTSPKTNEIDKDEQLRHYMEMLEQANFLLKSAVDKLEYLDMAYEFISIWAEYANQEGFSNQQKKGYVFMNLLYAKLVDWLAEHADSPLVLLLANIACPTLEKAPTQIQKQFGLRIVETCIATYFNRCDHCKWHEISQTVRIPKPLKQLLFTIPSTTEPFFLTLNAILLQEAGTTDCDSKLKLLKLIADYLSSIKPKYVEINEPAFILCVEKWQQLCISLFTDPNSSAPSLSIAYEHFDFYLLWLHRVYMADSSKNGGFFFIVTNKFARKTTYSSRIQLLANVIHLFLSQQLTSKLQPPRLHAGQNIFNSQLKVFQDLQEQKIYNEYNHALTDITQYFLNGLNYCLNDANAVYREFALYLYPNERILQKLE